MKPVPPVTSTRVMSAVVPRSHVPRRRTKSCVVPVGNRLDNRRKIMSEAERDKQFRDHEHRSEQQVRRVVQQRRPSTFEHVVSDSLCDEAEDNKSAGNRPHAGGTRMVRDHRRDCNQERGGDEDAYSKRNIEQQPADHDRHNRNGRRGGFVAKYVDGQGAEGQHRAQEQKCDAEDVDRAVPGIAMIFNVIHKLAFKIAIHTVLATALACAIIQPCHAEPC